MSDRDDLYALTRNGVKIDRNKTEGERMFRLDRPHIFTDDHAGELMPASLMHAKKNRKIAGVRGKSLKLGVTHSHDEQHRYHILEEMVDRPTDMLSRFRRWIKRHREERRKSRDR
jgi:hypothetical protein